MFKNKARDLYGEIRSEFIFLMTVDGDTNDARKKGFNQAIFGKNGDAVFCGTDLYMILEKFDKAIKNIKERRSE